MICGELWKIASTAAGGLLYVMAIVGLWLVFSDSWTMVYRQFLLHRRYRMAKRNKKEKGRFRGHLHMVLQSSLQHPCSAEVFVCFTGLLFLAVLFVSLRTFGVVTAVGIASMAAAMPYSLLRLRLEMQRKKGSMEGEKVTSELLRQYRIAGDNIYEAMERIIPQLNDCRVCQKQLFRLLMVLRNTGSTAEMREAAEVFSYSVGTNWSYMLSNSIRMAAEKGISISMGLEDILVQMRQAQAAMEERKRMNSESARITIFLVPIMYVATVILSLYYLEMSPMQFVENQIGTPEGLILLLSSVFLFAINLAILEIVNNQKLDF